MPREVFSTATEETQAEFALLLSRGGFNDEALAILANARTPTSFPVLYALGVINAAQKQLRRRVS